MGRDAIAEKDAKEKESNYRNKIRKIEELEKSLDTTLPRPPKPGTTPFWRGEKVDFSLNKMNNEEKLKYIGTGKKPIGLDKRKSK